MKVLGVLVTVVALLVTGALAGPSAATPEPQARVSTPGGPGLSKAVAVKPGRYKGRLRTSQGKLMERFSLKVTKRRVVRDWKLALDVTCVYVPPEVETHAFLFPKTKINKAGVLKRTWRPTRGSKILVKLKFKGRRLVSGSLDYTVGVCVRTARLKGRHA